MHLAVGVVEAVLVALLKERQTRETEQHERRQDDMWKIDPRKPRFLWTTVDAPTISIPSINMKTEGSTLNVQMMHAIATTSPSKKTTTQTLVVFSGASEPPSA